MKWISLILSFLFGAKPTKSLNFKELAMEIYEEALFRSRTPVALILMGLASVILVCGGLLMALIDVTRQYDTAGSISPGAVFWSGLILSAIFLTGYYYVFSRAWPGARGHHAKTEQAARDTSRPPGLDEALSLLIMDHIEERKAKRSAKQDTRGKTPPPHSEHHDTKGSQPTGFA